MKLLSILFLALALFADIPKDISETIDRVQTEEITDSAEVEMSLHGEQAEVFDTEQSEHDPQVLGDELDQASEQESHGGFVIGSGWFFGSSTMATNWVKDFHNSSKELLDSLEELNNIRYRTTLIQNPTEQVVFFPLQLGWQVPLQTGALTITAELSHFRKKGIFSLSPRGDTLIDLTKSATLRQHTSAIVIKRDIPFDSQYFTIEGKRESGISLVAGAIPQSRVTVKDSYSRGRGVIWGLELYAISGEGHKRRSSIGYRGSSIWGLSTLPTHIPDMRKHIQSHSLNISISFIRGNDEKAVKTDP